ncbi:MAG: flagellar motor switch protein FliN [Acetobacteraceae bacterium]|nr:flagellar motor switch protein FliN [Acetobacteraceae bacterium]
MAKKAEAGAARSRAAAAPASPPAPNRAGQAPARASSVIRAAPSVAQRQKCGALASAFARAFQEALSTLVGRPLVCGQPDVAAPPPWSGGQGKEEWVVGRAAIAKREAAGREAVLAVLPLQDGLMLADLISGGDGAALAAGLAEVQADTLGEALSQAVLAWAPALGLSSARQGPALEWLGLEVMDAGSVEQRLAERWTVAAIPWSLDGGSSGRVYLALEDGVLECSRSAEEEVGGEGAAAAQARPVVNPARFPALSPTTATGPRHSIDILVDVPLQLTVELGRSTRRIKDILSLGPGAVIELDKLAGEAVDVLVNGKLIAKGEVVVIDENFGVRITDIISPMERVTHLGG